MAPGSRETNPRAYRTPKSCPRRTLTDKTVCNLTLADHRSYFVSALAFLVHNISWCDEYIKYLARVGNTTVENVTRPQLLIDKAIALGYKASAVHAHHIVMKTAGWNILGDRYRYTKAAQDLLKKYGVELLEDSDSIARAGDDFDNMCWAINYADGIHPVEYARYISNELAKAVKNALDDGLDAKQAIKAKLAEWKLEFESGNTFWK